eukprot:gene7716-2602_t
MSSQQYIALSNTNRAGAAQRCPNTPRVPEKDAAPHTPPRLRRLRAARPALTAVRESRYGPGPARAPPRCANLTKTGFYNGLHVHRVIPEFMVQFGC